MSKKKTQKEFEQEVFDLTGEEYSVLGDYQNNCTKIKMKHNICGCEYEVSPNSFLGGRRCAKCYGNIKKTQEEFEQEVFDLTGEEYSVLGDYQNNHTKIKMKHKVCGCEYEIKPYSFLGGNRCPKCFGKHKKTQEEFEKEVYELTGEKYEVLGDYQNNHTKIKMKHKVCGYEYEVVPNGFLGGSRCPKCCGNVKKTQKEFKQEVFDLTGDEYTVLGEYINTITKIRMKHNICGYEYEIKPNNFSNGCRCPKCNSSHGEKSIDDFLKNRKISYQGQYKFKDCRSTRPLPFDFAVFDEKGNIKLLIEYQGEQHYKNKDFFFKEDSDFVDRIITDNKKRAYCEYNNIPLLEISYTDYDNIESILIDTLGLKG